MNSFGVFREKEIDGKPFLIFDFLSLTDNSSSFSSSSSTGEATIVSADDKDFSLQLHFLCPKLRRDAEMLKREEDGLGWGDLIPSSISPHMNGVDKHVQYLLTNDNGSICKDPVLPIFSYDDKDDVLCSACFFSGSAVEFSCATCYSNYHKECVESPLFFKHPSFPFLSLQLYPFMDGYKERKCVFCRETVEWLCYHCPLYELTMHVPCAIKSIPILIDHQKRHPHTLTFFPKQNSLACNVCSMVKPSAPPTYVCARCVYVVHQDCIYFPNVIRISRHQHRISFTCSLPSGTFTCGVCRKKVDNDCGAYSCDKCDGYYVHSRCAVRRDLWDGEELEGVPEEVEIVVEPFETMADGTIRHFSHAHHRLKLEIVTAFDENKYCQSCVLPIYQGNYYSCVDDNCDFILHETCAAAPLQKHHPLHARSLRLKVVTNEYDNNRGHFRCSACLRLCCGFVYEENDGVGVHSRYDFRLDIRCASISEPFNYEGHEHPLFLALSPEEEEARCQICQYSGERKLNCIECNFIICFCCATIPYKAMYRHDKHILTFQKATVENDQSAWCEVCEKKIVYSQKGGYYACDDYCCTTLHVDCLLGMDPYMKHGHTIFITNGLQNMHVDILRNNTMSRPSCCGGDICDDKQSLYRVFFKSHHYTYCSTRCLEFK